MNIKLLVNNKEEIENVQGYIHIMWSDDEQGMGNIYLDLMYDGTVRIDSEHKSKDFVKKIFNKIIDDAEELL